MREPSSSGECRLSHRLPPRQMRRGRGGRGIPMRLPRAGTPQRGHARLFRAVVRHPVQAVSRLRAAMLQQRRMRPGQDSRHVRLRLRRGLRHQLVCRPRMSVLGHGGVRGRHSRIGRRLLRQRRPVPQDRPQGRGPSGMRLSRGVRGVQVPVPEGDRTRGRGDVVRHLPADEEVGRTDESRVGGHDRVDNPWLRPGSRRAHLCEETG
mmetsp:Transcript_29837/g.70003  ORF Transcript_29837/g.70003 Transcript_29837/m.70003 type:complete len:207 (+) Transcript_29837:171-791(+)